MEPERRVEPRRSNGLWTAAGLALLLAVGTYGLLHVWVASARTSDRPELPVIPGVVRPVASPPGSPARSEPSPAPQAVPTPTPAAAPAPAAVPLPPAPPDVGTAATAAPGTGSGAAGVTVPAPGAPPWEPDAPAPAPVRRPAADPSAALPAPPEIEISPPATPAEAPLVGTRWTIVGSDAGLVLAQIEAVPPGAEAIPPDKAPRYVAGPTDTASSGVVRPDGVVVEALADAIRLVSAPSPAPEPNPVADLVPPLGLVGAVLEGTSLSVSPTSRGAAVVAIARLRARDGVGAAKALEGAVATPGVRVLRAYAALARRELPAVHELLIGLGEDVTVGPVARVLTGAALRGDGNAREAVRDFEGAARERPAFWPAHLLAAEAYESEDLRLPEKAAAAYAAAADSAPREPAVVLGHAYYRALAKDHAGPRTDVERLVADHPALVPAWRLLSWIRTGGGTPDDLRAAAEALEHVTALAPDDPRAWGELGGARWKWGAAGGGPAALTSAADAFGRQAALTPHDGLAWFNRGGTIHQAAVTAPLLGDTSSFRERFVEARTCYAKALAPGLARRDAARVHFNVGLLLETWPALPSVGDELPMRASDAFTSALSADPTYAAAAFALVAARISEKDAAGAAKAFAEVPAGADPREQAVLEAGVAWTQGDAAKARTVLVGAGGIAADGTDVLLALARSFLVLGYRRATTSLLSDASDDVTRITLKARADAGLRDLEALRGDLEKLAAVDEAAATALRANDADVLAALGPPPAVPPPR